MLTAPPEAVVCHCSGVTKGQIMEAVSKGARSLAEIKAATGACTVARCGELSPRRR
ncbi:MAG: (2Fe-2S)-binding protein [Desulfarculus sp.]|nr:(2Fe-2S)-binding protein [Desulfarculus sp.]